jgi:hypothetical protein
MASKVDICNRALDLIGAERITSLNEDSKSGKLCLRNYDKSRDAVLEAHDWSSCVKRTTLAPLAEAPEFQYANQFQLPSDCIRVLEAYSATSLPEKEGRRLLSDDNAINLKYVARVDDPNEYDPALRELIAYKLAADICFAITNNSSMTQYMANEYRVQLAETRSIDSAQARTDKTYISSSGIFNVIL